MDHRTRATSFKKVMWFRRGLGYGNDVLDQPVEAWITVHEERYDEFASRFLPRGS